MILKSEKSLVKMLKKRMYSRPRSANRGRVEKHATVVAHSGLSGRKCKVLVGGGGCVCWVRSTFQRVKHTAQQRVGYLPNWTEGGYVTHARTGPHRLAEHRRGWVATRR